MNNERLNYGDRIIYMEGVVVDIDDCSISVDLKGRLGFFKAPKRMFICSLFLIFTTQAVVSSPGLCP